MEALATAAMNQYALKNVSGTDYQGDQTKHSYLDIMPFIFFSQTYGGPDHNIKFMRFRLSVVAIFLLGKYG